MIRAVVAVLLLIPVAACGWAEWPPPGGNQPTIARPAEPKPPVTAATSGPSAADSVDPGAAVPPASVETASLPSIVRQPGTATMGTPGAAPSQAGTEHVVRPGETLYSIAQAHNVDIYALASANGLVAPYNVRDGQSLMIPSTHASRPPQESKIPVLSSPPKPQPRGEATAKPEEMRVPPQAGGEDSAAPIPAPPPISGDGFIWPVKGEIISAFGAKDQGNQNDGINISAPRGTPVRATENGVVAYAGNELRGFGNLVLIRHSDGWITAYAHNDTLLVRRGQIVRKGQDIATVGSSGGVAQPQLHFQLRQGKNAIDPVKHLSGGSA